MEELFELTVNNYKQPTTLPLRTYHLTTTNLQPYYYLTTTNTRSTKGTPKVKGGENNLHKIDVVEVGWSMSTTSIDRCRRRRFRGYGRDFQMKNPQTKKPIQMDRLHGLNKGYRLSLSRISIISAGVTTIGVLGKCFILPVIR